MNTRLFCAALFAVFLTATVSPNQALAQQSPAASTCNLVLHIDGFRNQKGDVGLSVFNSPDGWPENNDKAFLHGPHPITGTTTTISVQVPSGRYAVAILHDENSNHKMDRNFIGIPKEGFGFSNNPHAFLTPPSFNTAAIAVACPATEISIHLKYD